MAKDRYRFFRIEARELLDALQQAVAGLSGDGAADSARAMLRAAHTLKGAAGVVDLRDLSSRAHDLEDLLAGPASGEPPDADALKRVDQLLEMIRAGIEGIPSAADPTTTTAVPAAPAPPLTPPPPVATAHEVHEDDSSQSRTTVAAIEAPTGSSIAPVSVESASETVRIPVAGLDDLLRIAAKARNRVRSMDGASTGDPGDNVVESLLGDLDTLWDQLCEIRLVPGGLMTDAVGAAATQAARTLDKDIVFEVAGRDNRIDARIATELLPGMVHAVRNAVDHGIESRPERVENGKPPVGVIRMAVETGPSTTTLICEDDGRGIDVTAVARSAVAKGLIDDDRAGALDTRSAIELITTSGFSSRDTPTQVSGRGLGLDILARAIRRLNGRLQIDTRRGRGTRVVAVLPRSVVSLTAIRLHAGNAVAWLPFAVLTHVYRRSELEHADLDGMVMIGDEAVPAIDVEAWLGGGAGRRDRPMVALAVQDDVRMAFHLDRVGEPVEIVVQSIPARAGNSPGLLGATLDARGDPEPVIDLLTVARGDTAGPVATTVDAEADAPIVLVVDDSLTSRMVEQGILEAAGYEVDLAESGETGLQMVAQRAYDLVLCDVEMPGMNGFEFVRYLRGDDRYAGLPIVLVTTLDSDADRRRGMEAGAAAYVVKTELDERELLRLAGRLTKRNDRP